MTRVFGDSMGFFPKSVPTNVKSILSHKLNPFFGSANSEGSGAKSFSFLSGATSTPGTTVGGLTTRTPSSPAKPTGSILPMVSPASCPVVFPLSVIALVIRFIDRINTSPQNAPVRIVRHDLIQHVKRNADQFDLFFVLFVDPLGFDFFSHIQQTLNPSGFKARDVSFLFRKERHHQSKFYFVAHCFLQNDSMSTVTITFPRCFKPSAVITAGDASTCNTSQSSYLKFITSLAVTFTRRPLSASIHNTAP